MARFLAKAGLAILLALIINAAVAWLCAIAVPRPQVEPIHSPPLRITQPSPWLDGVGLSEHPDQVHARGQLSRYIGCTYTGFILVAAPSGDDPTLTVPRIAICGQAVRCEAGWPCRCFAGVVDHPSISPHEGRWAFWELGRLLPYPAGPITRFTVLWPGLLANLAVYLAFAWAVAKLDRPARPLVRFIRARCRVSGHSPTGVAPDAVHPEGGSARG